MPENNDPNSYPREILDSDPYLYQEQFDVPAAVSRATHQRLMSHVATYRSVVAVLTMSVRDGGDYGDRLSAREARSLGHEAAAMGVPVAYFAIPADRGGSGPETIFPGLAAHEYIDLYRPDRDAAFYEVHPPAATLDEFAALLIEELKTRKFLPGA